MYYKYITLVSPNASIPFFCGSGWFPMSPRSHFPWRVFLSPLAPERNPERGDLKKGSDMLFHAFLSTRWITYHENYRLGIGSRFGFRSPPQTFFKAGAGGGLRQPPFPGRGCLTLHGIRKAREGFHEIRENIMKRCVSSIQKP